MLKCTLKKGTCKRLSYVILTFYDGTRDEHPFGDFNRG